MPLCTKMSRSPAYSGSDAALAMLRNVVLIWGQWAPTITVLTPAYDSLLKQQNPGRACVAHAWHALCGRLD